MTQTVIHSNNAAPVKESKKGKLVMGIVVGAVVGGALAMMDTTTRKKVTSATTDMKNSTLEMYNHVKNNPDEVKKDLQERLTTASAALKEGINDAQDLYEKVNTDIMEQVHQLKDTSSDILSTTKEVTSGIKDIGSKVKDAGEVVLEEKEGNGEMEFIAEDSENPSTDKVASRKIPGEIG